MRKTDIERIIKQGSPKQKIKLYFTDIAHFNTIGQYTAKIKGSGDTATLDRPKKILTDKERDIIFNSIKEPKDIKYWEELRTWNKAFLMFKPTISTYSKNFDYLTAQLSKYAVVSILHQGYESAINDILEVVEEKKLREKLVNTALQSLNVFNAKRYQEEGFLPFIEIPEATINGKVWLLLEVLNEKIKEAKEYIKGIETFLNKSLPLQPYKQFLKEEEDKIKANINECINLIKCFENKQTVETPLDNAIVLKSKDKGEGELPDEKFIILNYDEVEVKVTDEDIEDIKNAGL